MVSPAELPPVPLPELRIIGNAGWVTGRTGFPFWLATADFSTVWRINDCLPSGKPLAGFSPNSTVAKAIWESITSENLVVLPHRRIPQRLVTLRTDLRGFGGGINGPFALRRDDVYGRLRSRDLTCPTGR